MNLKVVQEVGSTQGNGGYTRNRGGNVEHQVGYNRTPTDFLFERENNQFRIRKMRSILKYDTNRINAHCNLSTKKNIKQKNIWKCHCSRLPESVEI